MVLASFVIAFFLKDKPDGSVYSAVSNPDEFHVTPSLSQGIGLFQALLLPNVIPYCLCNGCLKLVNYAFFFWLPYYMTTQYGWTEAGANYVAAFYDVGGIIGSLVGGIISDRMGSRSPVVVIMLVLSLGSLFLFTEAGGGVLLNVLLMAMVGLTISGPYNLIVSTISIDLGSQSVLSGNAKAMATVSGLIDGTGSIGSAAGQLIVPIIQNVFGWNTVFYLFVLLNGIAILCLTPKFLVDVGFLPTRRLHRRESEPLLSTAD
ncbi:hypothetical protein AB6A40_009225 [Gnathostoma spinigerum]|uniref:Major facilitator superfamily (MFS) profile domain-containing protein n=1 Tax=Gnathostoma spinigerum TaxID=75299 RepID=A0ABD6ET72_9BILA